MEEPRERGFYWLKSHGQWIVALRYEGEGVWACAGSEEVYSWKDLRVMAWHGPLMDPDAAQAAMRRLGLSIKEEVDRG